MTTLNEILHITNDSFEKKESIHWLCLPELQIDSTETHVFSHFLEPPLPVILFENDTTLHLGIELPRQALLKEQLSKVLKKAIWFSLIKNKRHSSLHSPHKSIQLFLSDLLNTAFQQRASDIHLEPGKNGLCIRFRIDGILHIYAHYNEQISDSLISRLKIIAKLDIAEKRLPQDGRFEFETNTGKIQPCRVSTLANAFGEKAVIRLLQDNQALLPIHELGLSQNHQELFNTFMQKPHGLWLITGPTGSGKTITLYAILHALNTSTKHIATVEDPIEIHLPGLHQVQVHPKANLFFSNVLRALLRQDPDILMVGEIRDKETAEIALHAANTGHLVLATLHTNSAMEAIHRLLQMGVPAYQLSATLQCVVAQRLVRRLCPYCFNKNLTSCLQCHNGYKGRIGIYECVPFCNELTLAIEQSHSLVTLQSILKKLNIPTLLDDANEKIKSGITSKEEIKRVLS